MGAAQEGGGSRPVPRLVTLGDGQRLDDAGELAELGGDAVALGLELGDLGAGTLERPAGAVTELVGLGTALGDQGERLLAGPATVLGGLGSGCG